MHIRSIIQYVLAGLAVVILGALAGWYFFLHGQTKTTIAFNAARGFGSQVPAGSVQGSASAFSATTSAPGTSAATAPVRPPQLSHIADAPVGGIGFSTTTQGVRLRYVERATGYVFEADPMGGGIVRIANALMPKIYEAYFASGDRIIERSLSTGGVTTFAGLLGTATSSALSGTSLPNNIVAVAPDPKTAQLFYLQRTGSEVVGVTSAWDGSKPKQVFSSALSDWRASWLPDGSVVLVQNAADSVVGYAYTLKNGVLHPLAGPLLGLTVLPRTGSGLLYGTSSGGGLALFSRTSATTTAVRLPIATVADKCVWAPGAAFVAYCAVPQTLPLGGFLDAWYRGETHSSDAIWRVDASAGQAQLVFAPTSNISLDVINPVMDDEGNYIAFMNATDQSPWLLRLNK